jgi:hypothetical protein
VGAYYEIAAVKNSIAFRLDDMGLTTISKSTLSRAP